MSDPIEPVEAFRQRARTWIKDNLGPIQPEDIDQDCGSDAAELIAVARDRTLQRKLFDAGFAGIVMPREYGGQGLTPAHQQAFNEELAGHEYPSRFTVPTFSPCAAVLLEFGNPAQKAKHLPKILRGESFWVQMLSEPGGGSDVAGAATLAVRDGDGWILNGSKVWTSRAYWADWGLVLARTNVGVPKHQGLTVFMVPLNAPGLEIHRIERLNGESESCQEFLTDVRVPDSARIGEIDAGWSIGTRWMYYERLGHHSPFVTQPTGLTRSAAHGPSPVA
ncbi:MAG: acyl-CoA dehydrogenase, partial [Sphingomonadales bacterium]